MGLGEARQQREEGSKLTIESAGTPEGSVDQSSGKELITVAQATSVTPPIHGAPG